LIGLSGRIALVSILALCVAASSPEVLAAQAPDAARSSAKSKTKTKTKAKSRIRSKKTATKPVARSKRKVVRKPPPPAAEIPAVLESASVWRGCLESQDLPKLASSLGIEPVRLETLLDETGSSAGQSGGCMAYVAATGGESGVASVIFRYTEPAGDSRTLALHKTPDGIITTPAVCDCHESIRRVLSMPVRDFASSSSPVSESIPANILWELDILVPRMIAGLGAEQTTASDEGPEAVPVDSYTARVVLGRNSDDERERLESVEILEPVSGRRVNGAWWLDRPDGPGVIIGMDGVAYERLLWESPVKYVRSSRGVGASVTTWRRRVPSKPGSPKSTVVRTVQVPGFHLGIDMSAPKGTDVHAVGDAKVDFAGKKRGYGNLIILDHGRGYQTYYAHLSKIEKGIQAGVPVARGDVIGLVGSTGHSTGPHLHFETRKDARYLDPFDGTHQLEFWLLTADEQERLAMQLLSTAPIVAEEAQGPR
jgi:hypothetical protein